jgi:CBS-domain-containing membrane protein
MLTAADVMTRNPITVSRETTVEELAGLFVQHRIGTIPVTEPDGRLVGVVTETDLVEQDRNLHLPTVVSLFDWVIYLEDDSRFQRELRKITGRTVADLCTTDVVFVSPDTPIDRIADLMADKRISAIPVTDEGRLVGIVSRIDLIRTMVTP